MHGFFLSRYRMGHWQCNPCRNLGHSLILHRHLQAISAASVLCHLLLKAQRSGGVWHDRVNTLVGESVSVLLSVIICLRYTSQSNSCTHAPHVQTRVTIEPIYRDTPCVRYVTPTAQWSTGVNSSKDIFMSWPSTKQTFRDVCHILFIFWII